MKKNVTLMLFLFLGSWSVAFSQYSSGIGKGDFSLTALNANSVDLLLYTSGTGRGDFSFANYGAAIPGFPMYNGGISRGDFALDTNDANHGDLPLYSSGTGRGDFSLALFGAVIPGYPMYGSGVSRGDCALLSSNANHNDLALYSSGTGRGDFSLAIAGAPVPGFPMYGSGTSRGDFALLATDVNNSDFHLYSSGTGRGDFALGVFGAVVPGFPMYASGTSRGDHALSFTDANRNDFHLYSSGTGRGDISLTIAGATSSDFQLYKSGNGRGEYSLRLLNANQNDFHLYSSGTGRGEFALAQLNLNPPSCVYPGLPTVNASATSICTQQGITLSIATGNLNSATKWQWYKGSCGGIPVDTGTSITVSPAVTTTYFVRGEGGCVIPGNCGNKAITFSPCGVELKLVAFIQGYYKGSGYMVPALYNEGVSSDTTLTDSVSVDLRLSSPPYSIVESKTGLLATDGVSLIQFNSPLILNSSLYIVVRHRNSLETWSNAPQLFNSANKTYAFSTAANKAYGNNMADLNDGRFALINGDVNGDNTIDMDDFSRIETRVNDFETGYLIFDINGDGLMESVDYSLVENNLGKILLRP